MSSLQTKNLGLKINVLSIKEKNIKIFMTVCVILSRKVQK